MEPQQTPNDQPTQAPTPTPAPTSTQPSTPQGAGAFAITSLVTGIVAFVLGFTFIGFILGAAAVVFGILALKKNQNKGMAIAGIITGGLGFIASLIVTAIAIIALATSGALASELTNSVQDTAQEQQAVHSGKKDFAKGEVGKFGEIELTVNSVKRNHTPEESYMIEEGKEYIVVNLTTKNLTDESVYVSSFDYEIVAGGVGQGPSFIDVEPKFTDGNLEADASTSGNIVFQVAEGAADLKLKYTTYSLGETVEYTIAL